MATAVPVSGATPWALYEAAGALLASVALALAPMAAGQYEEAAAKLAALQDANPAWRPDDELAVFVAQQVQSSSQGF